jgi:hypothetical protein
MPNFVAVDTTTGRKKTYTEAEVIALLKVDNEVFSALTFGTTTTWNTNGRFVSKRNLTLTGNTTLSITNVVNGQVGTLIVVATATGVITLPTGSFRTNGFDLNFINGTRKVLSYIYNGTNYYWSGSECV